MGKYLQIKDVSKSYGEYKILDNFSLEVGKKDFFALVGPSGCGKTTLLRIIAGFEHPDSGYIRIGNEDLLSLPPHERSVNIMFQSYALFPHMKVYDNIAFGLYCDGLEESKISKKVNDMIDLLQLGNCVNRYPDSLSGGQKQRVALARSLVQEPTVLLLDEPLAAIDKNLRQKMQLELVSLQEELGMTFIVVTHDQEEAMTMATHIAVMKNGLVSQVGTPIEMYECPNSLYVAKLLGEVNVIKAIVKDIDAGYIHLENKDNLLSFYVCKTRYNGTQNLEIGQNVTFMIRPEKIFISMNENTDYIVEGKVADIAYLGSYSNYHILLKNGFNIKVSQMNLKRMIEQDITWDDKVYLKWSSNAGMILSDFCEKKSEE